MKTKRKLVPKSVVVSGSALPVERHVVAQVCGALRDAFDSPFLKRSLVKRDSGQDVCDVCFSSPLKRMCVPQSYSSPCVGQQSYVRLGVSLVGQSVSQSKRNVVSQDDGQNVYGIGSGVPLKRPCVRQSNSVPRVGAPVQEGLFATGMRLTVSGQTLSQSANHVNVNTCSVPIDEHYDYSDHGVDTDAFCSSLAATGVG
ncbi:hypothetical protein Tco_0447880 [Tanacetum coccineum]